MHLLIAMWCFYNTKIVNEIEENLQEHRARNIKSTKESDVTWKTKQRSPIYIKKHFQGKTKETLIKVIIWEYLVEIRKNTILKSIKK